MNVRGRTGRAIGGICASLSCGERRTGPTFFLGGPRLLCLFPTMLELRRRRSYTGQACFRCSGSDCFKLPTPSSSGLHPGLGGVLQTRAARRWMVVPEAVMQAIAETCPPDDRTPERRVFLGFSADVAKNVMARACKATGIPHFHPHDLRHRYASVKLREGVPVTDRRSARRRVEHLDSHRGIAETGSNCG
jgi:hypothetical protein